MKASVDHLAIRASKVHCHRQHSLSAILSPPPPRARACALSCCRYLSLCISISRSLSIIRPTECISLPIRVAIVFSQRFPFTFSSSSASDINQASSCRHCQARNPLKGFFEITRQWMIHRPHDRQYRRDKEGVILTRLRTYGLSAPNYLLLARCVAVSMQSVTQTVHSLGVDPDFPRIEYP